MLELFFLCDRLLLFFFIDFILIIWGDFDGDFLFWGEYFFGFVIVCFINFLFFGIFWGLMFRYFWDWKCCRFFLLEYNGLKEERFFDLYFGEECFLELYF